MTSSIQEIEIKLRLSDVDKMRESLLLMGFSIRTDRAFEDNHVYDFAGHSLRFRDCLLRIRDYAGKTIVTFKGPAQPSSQFKIREEIEAETTPSGAIHRILAALEFQVVFRYQKYRTEYVGNWREHSVHLMLDETPIGNYLEIEGDQEGIDTVASALGFKREDYITESYLALFFKQNPKGATPQMVFSKDHPFAES
jgi:adenylate cyclase class 2